MCLQVQFGYDGPVKLWFDGKQEYHDPEGTNPAAQGKACISFGAGRGPHEIMIALGSNYGQAWGIYLNIAAAAEIGGEENIQE